MSDEKKDLNVDAKAGADAKTEGNIESKGTSESTPTIEDLKAEIAKRDELISNLKGTQSATSKNLDELKTTVDSYKGAFEKAGIDLKDLNSVIEKQTRSNILMQVAAEKGLSAAEMKFITGNTKEEIEASVDELQALMQKNIEVSVESAKKEVTKKVVVPKNNQQSVAVKEADEAEQAKAFLANKGMISK